MRVWTLQEMREKIQADLDLTQEDFVSQAELDYYIRDAIDIAEAEIHKLGRESQYFLRSGFLSITSGTATYSLPSDIYGNKIVRILDLKSNTDYYPVTRLRSMDRFMEAHDLTTNASGEDDYRYLIIHTSAAVGYQIEFHPTPDFTSSTRFKIWYIRNANDPSANSDKIDVPEAAQFIQEYAKFQVKRKSGEMREADAALLEATRKSMVETLSPMVDDEDDTIIEDFSHYEEHN